MKKISRPIILLVSSLLLGTLAYAQEPDLTKSVPGETKKKKVNVPVVKDDNNTMNEQIQPNGTISVTPAPKKKRKVVIVPAQPPGAPPIPVPKKR